MLNFVDHLSSSFIPLIIFLVSSIILFGKKDYFSSFLLGAKDGILSACKLLPTICALVVGITIFDKSGASDFISNLVSPFFTFLKVPSGILPLIITRPLSGSASLATFEGILTKFGVDSFEGICSSLIMSSSDTVLYVISIYFSTSKIKKTRYALFIALTVSLFCVFFSSILTSLFFF